MTTTVTIAETPVEVTVSEEAVTANITETETTVTVDTGVTDHGALSGLADDDHAQYLTTARHAAIGDNPHGVTAVDVGALPLSGGTMTGKITLDGDPTAALHAATKQYVDANAGGGDVGDLTTDAGEAGEMLRVAAAGGLEFRPPAQVLADIGAAGADDLDDYLPLAGGTLTGALSVPSSESSVSLHPAGNTQVGIALSASGYVVLRGGSAGQASIVLNGAGLLFSGIERLQPPPGTVASPGLAWSNDGDTGFTRVFESGGATVHVSDGVEVMRTTLVGTKATVLDAITVAVSDVLHLRHNSTNTPAAGFGAGLLYQLESSTTENRNAARIAAVWTTATDASRKADLVLSAYDTAERVGLRVRATGSAALLITSLPTSDPAVAGALWSDSGTVKVSSG